MKTYIKETKETRSMTTMILDLEDSYYVLKDDGSKIFAASETEAKAAWEYKDIDDSFVALDVELFDLWWYKNSIQDHGVVKTLFGEFANYAIEDGTWCKKKAVYEYIDFLKTFHGLSRRVTGLSDIAYFSLLGEAYLLSAFEYAGEECDGYIPQHWRVLSMMRELMELLYDSVSSDKALAAETEELIAWLNVVDELCEKERQKCAPKERKEDNQEAEDGDLEIVNLTPHTINFVLEDGSTKAIPSSGTIARVSVQNLPNGEILGIPVTQTVYGEVENLPEPTDGTIYIVSSLVAQRCHDRDDVFIPNEPVRDEEGRITGCRSLGRV